jgi:hypothetical protein
MLGNRSLDRLYHHDRRSRGECRRVREEFAALPAPVPMARSSPTALPWSFTAVPWPFAATSSYADESLANPLSPAIYARRRAALPTAAIR